MASRFAPNGVLWVNVKRRRVKEGVIFFLFHFVFLCVRRGWCRGMVWWIFQRGLDERSRFQISTDSNIYRQYPIFLWATQLYNVGRYWGQNYRYSLYYLYYIYWQSMLTIMIQKNQGSKYRISGSYRMGVFHIGYRISGEISRICAHVGRSYQTLYIMKYW